MTKTRCTAPAVTLLAAGLIAGCGSSSKTATGPASASAKTTSASQSSGASSVNPYSSGSSSSSSSSQRVALITTKKHGSLGPILAYGPKKLTVYLFEADKAGKSACTGSCARFWPPVIGTPKAGAGAMSADLGTITRSDGTKQLTYKGHPLYTFVRDKDDGDAYGEGQSAFGADWYALSPSGSKVDNS
jgi:predicted lipoprotein with Yx(FWY)xxD motif